jgi:hypothetical protein
MAVAQACVPLLAATSAMTVLEYEWATSLDFGGIRTSEAEAGLARAAKGGMLSAAQLQAVVTLVQGEPQPRTSEASTALVTGCIHYI